ncbi:hypothetical protein PPIS_a0148 [Pseudoalteromonas piscicida]|uniref:Uncharacterized protein n=1 Tax=Pseudoalteromonas piscicida TaxID=43662 RepID=A0ABM6N9Q8_PSEO7|nr:hypothetical protein PPIS_a0148 [Pseudoalteromonas piscicida]
MRVFKASRESISACCDFYGVVANKLKSTLEGIYKKGMH